MSQKNWYLHILSYHVNPQAFQFTSARNGSVGSPGREVNFCYYQAVNHLHRCTSGKNAKTKWWFGEQ